VHLLASASYSSDDDGGVTGSKCSAFN
jgi:hypothetical protein